MISHILHFSKVDVLPFVNVCSRLGLAIIRKLEEWKLFAQLLVGEPTRVKLHIIEV